MSKTCCIIGEKELINSQEERARNYLMNEVDFRIFNGYTHFLISSTTDTDILAAEILTALKQKYKEIKLEIVFSNKADICFAPDEIKLNLPSFDYAYKIEGKYNNSSLKECYQYIINNSDIIIVIWNGKIDSEIGKQINCAKSKDKKVLARIV